jgi:Uma2 family endonuclease
LRAIYLGAVFAEREEVFVAGDLLWYPVLGKPYISVAPDALVVFGRTKGHRGSYEQWNEENIAPQVVFEVLSKANTVTEMTDKFLFYQKYGVIDFSLGNGKMYTSAKLV